MVKTAATPRAAGDPARPLLNDLGGEEAHPVRAALALAEELAGRPPGEQELQAARLLQGLQDDPLLLSAAVLRGVLDGTVDASLPVIEARLGTPVARLVEGVGRMDHIPGYRGLDSTAEDQAARLEGLRKLLLAMAEDLRVVLVRLAEQVALLRGLTREPDEGRRRRAAVETMDIYAPLANRLGIWQLKWELEDLSFRFLEPVRYQAIARALAERREDRERYIEEVKGTLGEALAREGIRAEVAGRPKHIYSIARKLERKNVDFAELSDVRAVRVLVDNVRDCYAALGVVHGLWPHVAPEFDDYIANPKGNRYRSLHTAVIGPQGRSVEVQIRTHEMHRLAELGVAAHWRYKEGGRQDADYEQKVAWVRQLLEPREAAAGDDFLERFKTEVFHDRVYALSPRGKVVDLPRGATPLDFAYAIHSDVGSRCRGAKVGGSIVPLTYQLRNGDQVEILTSRQASPSRDWLNPALGYLRTGRARQKVRQWFKEQDFDKNLAAGRELLERELRRLGAGGVSLEKLARKLRFPRLEDLLAAIGRGDVSTSQIAGAVQDQVLPAEAPLPESAPPARPAQPATGDVMVEGVGNLLTHLARCCKPAPPDAIVGFITRGQGVTVHRRDCGNVLGLDEEARRRLVDVSWGAHGERRYPVDVRVEAYDRQGLLRDITLLLANERLNVLGINSDTDRATNVARVRVTVEVPDVATLSRILGRLGQLPNVIDARRGAAR